ncbi:MAG: hypothetical protein OZ921_00025 [Sorangiineae bacterium]|nr:hypothetical protein [Polyangiaceae bacterium]MEB2320870.1 hypothetical protein [Sorangiineae bacterium]
MARNTEELERPTEWLRSLQEGRRPYRWLLDDAGGVALAAYRLARARCRVQPLPSPIPTLAEVCAAARLLWRELGGAFELPCEMLLYAECEASGLPLIVPESRHAA